MRTLFSSAGGRVAVVATVGLFLAGGVASASPAIGGPDLAASVHSAVAGDSHGHETQTAQTDDGSGGTGAGTGHEHCAQATQHALERLNELKAKGRAVENAIKAVENCGNGSTNHNDAQNSDGTEQGDNDSNDLPDQSSPNAAERSDNASEGINNANGHASTGMAHANDHAEKGSGNAP